MAVTNARISVDLAAPDSLKSGALKINENFDRINVHFARVETDVIRFDRTEVQITHQLQSYPCHVRVMMRNAYGAFGFGESSPDSNVKVQIPVKMEYLDENRVILHLDEEIVGSYTVTKGADSNTFQVAFANGIDLDVKFI
ncbi:hypothetical protein [Brevibacillus sp. SYSU BS000544]|uniref:hypothetical protein n=1 Tax=Brevibacillus sp. SYSU BS000544 TaxID=3416443 RepID=UPI003CE56DA0